MILFSFQYSYLPQGYFSRDIFVPFAVSSIPFAFIGGTLYLSGSFYKQVVGLILLFAAYRLFRYDSPAVTDAVNLFQSPGLFFSEP